MLSLARTVRYKLTCIWMPSGVSVIARTSSEIILFETHYDRWFGGGGGKGALTVRIGPWEKAIQYIDWRVQQYFNWIWWIGWIINHQFRDQIIKCWRSGWHILILFFAVHSLWTLKIESHSGPSRHVDCILDSTNNRAVFPQKKLFSDIVPFFCLLQIKNPGTDGRK